MFVSCLMEIWKYTVQRCLESMIILDFDDDKVILAIDYCVYLTIYILRLWLCDRGGLRGSETQYTNIWRDWMGEYWCCCYHWSENNDCSAVLLQCILVSASVSNCIMFHRDSLLRVVSAFCIIWGEFSAYKNKHIINLAVVVSVFWLPFANWLYELIARAFGWFLYPFAITWKSGQVFSYSNASQAPPLHSKPYFCPRVYKLICVAFLRLIFLLWFILEADTIFFSISQNDPAFIFSIILPKPFESTLN